MDSVWNFVVATVSPPITRLISHFSYLSQPQQTVNAVLAQTRTGA
jgi:hypothetical protein